MGLYFVLCAFVLVYVPLFPSMGRRFGLCALIPSYELLSWSMGRRTGSMAPYPDHSAILLTINLTPTLHHHKKSTYKRHTLNKCLIYRYLVSFPYIVYLFLIYKQLSIRFLASDISVLILNNHFNHSTFCYDICCCPVTDIMSIIRFHHWKFCCILQTTRWIG